MKRHVWLTGLALWGALLSPLAKAAVELGQESRWQTRVRIDIRDSEGGSASGIALTGEWRRTVVAVRPDSYDVEFQLASAKFETGPGQDPKQLQATEQRLRQPFWVTCANTGAFVSIHFRSAQNPSDRNVLQGIATLTQFVDPEITNPVWRSTERDGTGTYLAMYQRVDPTHVLKKKMTYVEAASQQSSQGLVETAVEQSEIQFAFSTEGPVSIEGAERLRFLIPGMRSNALISVSEIHLTSGKTQRSGTAVTGIPKDAAILPIATHLMDPQAAQEESDKQMLAGHTTASILDGAIKDAGMRQRLPALFRRRPESIALALQRLTSTEMTQAIANALVLAGTEAGRRAVLQVATDGARPVNIRVPAIAALGSVDSPTVDMMQQTAALIAQTDANIRHTARLATGSLARAGRSAHPAEANVIENAMAEQYQKTLLLDEAQNLLGALGNSGGPAAEREMLVGLKDTRDQIRSAAARGLRLVPGKTAETALIDALKQDKIDQVRADALFAISFRRPYSQELWEAVLGAAKSDASPSIRNRAISLIRGDSTRRSEALETLNWLAANDPTKEVRQQAAEAVKALTAAATRP